MTTILERITSTSNKARARTSLDQQVLVQLVAFARQEGHTWEQIGAALGVTRQAAQQMYGRVRVIEGDQ